MTRRGFLAALGAGGLSLGTASARPSPLTRTSLDEGLFMVSLQEGNVLVLSSSEGLLLVDCGLKTSLPVLTRLLRQAGGGQPVRWLFNTHWHLEHTGGNEHFAAAGARIVAQENTRLWMTRPIEVTWQGRSYPARPRLALPTQTFHYTTEELRFGGERIQYGYLPPGHTDGDLFVYLPERNVLATGDVVQAGGYPIIDLCTGGWIGGMVDATAKLLALGNDSTRIVPGSGALQSKAFLRAQLHMCQTVRDRIAETYRNARDFEDLEAQQPTREFDATWGDPRQFLQLAYDSARGRERDLGGIF